MWNFFEDVEKKLRSAISQYERIAGFNSFPIITEYPPYGVSMELLFEKFHIFTLFDKLYNLFLVYPYNWLRKKSLYCWFDREGP